jgi:hypothetical protein
LKSRWVWAGIVAGCGLAVLLVPEARWHAIDGICYAVHRVPAWQQVASTGRSPDIFREGPERQPQTFDQRLALATIAPPMDAPGDQEGAAWDRIRQLESLEQEFPAEPAVHAHLGRYYAAVLRLRPAYRQLSAGGPESVENRRHWEELRRLMVLGGQLEPDNAFFPQMLTAACLALGEVDEAREAWTIASHKGRKWRDYANDEVFAQWNLLSAVYGQRGARQRYPSIAMLRLPHLAMIEEAASVLNSLPPEAGQDPVQAELDMRLASARNGAVIRESARQVVSALVGVAIVDKAIQYPATPVRYSPKAIQERRAAFLRILEASRPSELGFARKQARANDGFRAQIPANSAVEFTGRNSISGRTGSWTGWLFRSIATTALPETAFGLMVWFLVAYALTLGVLATGLRWRFYLPERLRGLLSLAVGLAVGLLAYIGSGMWVIGLWYALLVGGLGYAAAATDVAARPPLAGTDYFTWTRSNTVTSVLTVLMLLGVGVYGFVFRFADFPGVHLALTGIEAPFTGISAGAWRALTWFATSLPLVLAIGWAASSGGPLIAGAAQGLARLSLVGAAVCGILFVLSLPVAVVFDRVDVERLELIAQNEPNYYRKTEAGVQAGYHEETEP